MASSKDQSLYFTGIRGEGDNDRFFLDSSGRYGISQPMRLDSSTSEKYAYNDDAGIEIANIRKTEKELKQRLKDVKQEKEKLEQAETWKTIKELEKKLMRVQQDKEELNQANARLQNMIKDLEAVVASAHRNLSKADNRLEAQKHRDLVELSKKDQELSKLKVDVVKADEENKSLVTRLQDIIRHEVMTALDEEMGEYADARSMDNNPNIAELSDRNRPTKLGDQYLELYDNEWTDALSELQDDGLTDDVQCITVLLTMLITTYKTCEEKAKSQNDGLIQSVTEFLKDEKLPLEMSNHFKETRKKNYANYLLELKQVLEPKLASIEDVTEKRLKSTESFYTKCLEICWLMCIQDPPMYIDCRTKLRGEKYYKGQYKEFTQSGPIIDYVVWPPIYLQKDGPILCKGTVQCTSSNDATNISQQKQEAGPKRTVLTVNASMSMPFKKMTRMSLPNATLTQDKGGKRSQSAVFFGETKGLKKS